MGRLKAGESYILEISAKDCSIPPYVLAREKKTVGENTVLTASGAETSLELLNCIWICSVSFKIGKAFNYCYAGGLSVWIMDILE